MTNEERRIDLIESLAAIEHQRWSDWQSHFFGKCTKNDDGSLTVPAGYVAALQELIDASYDDLSHDLQEADRREVGRYLPLIDTYASQYMPEMST